MSSPKKPEFKRVPALDKCFAILELLSRSTALLGTSEVARELDLNKSTVFNILQTLADLDVLEHAHGGKFGFGTRLHILANGAGRRVDLIRTVRPYLNEIASNSSFTAFFGIRYGLKAIIVDKMEAAVDIRVAAEVGMQLPLLSGAGGKALLSQLSNSQVDQILSTNELRKFTPHTCVDKSKFKEAVLKVREEGLALDWEEYIEGIIAAAVPINTHREGREAAIWAVGLRRQGSEREISELSQLLKRIARELDMRFRPA
ncbi:MAG: IclR family transcriptional regulator [Desulfomonile tiedjei]|uniref:IclR family transcriptional regulator n=1 Tax=Desulfomonile tiedjei TaxID=2358 RepID=A0A9D6V013_9BACT|nr:IclR family transcriptional regulator [Desulfomonile tiedjei]